MKKINLFLSILVLLSGFNSYAQKNNVVKFGYNLFTPVVTYERVLRENLSLNLDMMFLSYNAIILEENYVEDPTFNIIGFVPQIRFYTQSKKNAPKGFYIAPYLKYRTAKASLIAEIELIEDPDNPIPDGTNTTAEFQEEFNFTTMGAGLQFGAQFWIADMISIDLWFIGLGVNQNTLSIDYSTDYNFPDGYGLDSMVESFEENFSSIPYLGSKISVISTPNYLAVEVPYLFLDMRAGVSLGITF